MSPRGSDSTTSESAAEFRRLARVDEVLTAELRNVQGNAKPDVSDIVRRHPEIAKELRAALGGAIQLDRAARTVSPAEPPLPERLDNYRVIRELGRGGMGVVAEAHDVELDRRVAIKILPSAVSADAEYAARFQREAHAAARLEHPHVVPIYGVGEAGGQAYIAMKLVDGHGLDELLHELKVQAGDPGSSSSRKTDSGSGSSASRSRRVARQLVRERLDRATGSGTDESSWDDVAETDDDSRLHLGANYHRNVAKIGLGIASALSYAHARGVLHRDIKPGNILLDRRGHVWVADFGLAKVEEADDVTRDGEFVGTLRYMAPEQFQGHAEPRSDTYSLGLVLYELLTLRRAIQATDRAGLAYAVLHQDPRRPSSIRPEIPTDLERIVMKACAKLQEERYRTANDLAADLRAYLDGRPIAARMPSALYLTRLAVNRNRTLFTAVAVLLGLLSLGAALYVAELRRAREAESRLAYRSSLAAAAAALKVTDIPTAITQLASCPEDRRAWEWHHLSASVDQSTSTYGEIGEPVRQVYPAEFEGEAALAVTDRAGVTFLLHGGARRVDAPFRLDRDHHGLIHSQLAEESLYLVSADYGIARVSLEDASGADEEDRVEKMSLGGGCEVFSMLPDASRAVAIVRDRLRVIDPVKLAIDRTVPTNDATMRAVELARDGTRAWTVSLRGDIRQWDLETGREETLIELPAELTSVAIQEGRDDGLRWITAGGADGAIYRLDLRRDGPPEVKQLLGHAAAIRALTFSADGRRLASAGEDKTVRVWDIETGELVETKTGHSRQVLALLFKDGDRRLISGGRAGIVKTWELGVSAGRNSIEGHFADVTALDHSDDGVRFATGARDATIRVHDAASQRLDSLLLGHRSELNGLVWHPGSRYLTSADRAGVVLHWDVDSGEALWRARVQGVGVGPVVSPDASTVFVGGHAGDVLALDAATGAERAKARVSSDGVYSLAQSPSGDLLLAGTFQGQLIELDPTTLETQGVHDRHDARIAGIEFTQRGDDVLTVGWDRRLVISERRRLADTTDLDLGGAGHGWATDALDDLELSPDGRLCAVASHNWFVRLVDLPSRSVVLDLAGHTDWVRRVSFSPDGRSLVSTGSQGQVRVWDMHATEERREAVASRLALEEAGAALVRAKLGRAIEDPDDIDEALSLLARGSSGHHPELERAARGHLFQVRDAMVVEHWERRLCTAPTLDLAIGGRQYLRAQQRHRRADGKAERLAALGDVIRGNEDRALTYVERARRTLGSAAAGDPILEAIEHVIERRTGKPAPPPTWDDQRHPAAQLRTARLVVELPDAPPKALPDAQD